MRPFIIIKEYKKADDIYCQEVIKNYVMSHAKNAFYSCLFREITLQLIVLIWAILFIFFGVPLFICLLAAPFVVILLFLCVYVSHYNKAIETANGQGKFGLVAVAYEPYFLRCSQKDTEYDIVDENYIQNNSDINKLHRKIIGTLSVKPHNSLHNSAWLCRIGVDPKYNICVVLQPLLERILDLCQQKQYFSVEGVTNECQDETRDAFTKIGFTMQQIYHKQILGNSLRVMKAQLGINLSTWRNKNV